jgi:hypothetical protein
LVIALFTNQISAVQLESQNLIETSCPDSDGAIPIKIKHKKHGGGKLKKVLKAIADTEDEEPKVSVVRVPAPACPAAAKESSSCDAKKESSKEGAEEAGKKAGKEAKKAVEKALKK